MTLFGIECYLSRDCPVVKVRQGRSQNNEEV